MSRGKGRATEADTSSTPQAAVEPSPEVDPNAPVEERDEAAADLVTQDPYDKLDGMTPQEAVASSLGAPDQYPYMDKTAMPLHERNLPMTTDAGGPSQAELNPAFYPKAEDGGPVNAEGESIGTEPNAADKLLAAAENADPSGDLGTKDEVQEQIDKGTEQQMDAQAVTDAAQERAPDGIDASTGRKEGEATVPGAPSGMEPSSDGEAGTAGTPEGSDPSDGDKDNLR